MTFSLVTEIRFLENCKMQFSLESVKLYYFERRETEIVHPQNFYLAGYICELEFGYFDKAQPKLKNLFIGIIN